MGEGEETTPFDAEALRFFHHWGRVAVVVVVVV